MKIFEPSPIRIYFFVLFQIVVFNSCNVNSVVEREIAFIADTSKIKSLSQEALSFCKKNNFNTDFYFVIDMSIHLGKNHFMVWNFNEQKISQQGLVTHGCGNTGWSNDDTRTTPQFSNTCDSHCSSLGKYKVANRGYSQWGINIKYLLNGLDSSNSNAL